MLVLQLHDFRRIDQRRDKYMKSRCGAYSEDIQAIADPLISNRADDEVDSYIICGYTIGALNILHHLESMYYSTITVMINNNVHVTTSRYLNPKYHR